jgi:hypothetical protein
MVSGLGSRYLDLDRIRRHAIDRHRNVHNAGAMQRYIHLIEARELTLRPRV